MDKGFWMSKGAGHVNDVDPTFDNTSRIEPKRSHQWFVDAAETELFPSKKQAVQAPNNKSTSGMSNANIPSWENASSFHSVPSQFNYRFFGSETARPVNFAERNIVVETENPNVRRKSMDEQFGEDASVGLSISHAMEDPETCLTYGGIRKVKVNQVKDCDNGVHMPKGHDSNGENISHLSSGQAYNRESEAGFASIGQPYNQDDNVTLMGHTYNRGDANIRSTGPTFGNEDGNSISIGDTYGKGEANIISFGGFPDEQDIIPVGRPVSNYDLLYTQSSVQTLETAHEKESDQTNADTVLSTTPVAKLRPESVSKNKPEFKTSRKEAPNSFPSNVRSLISTGMLDGVPVKYVSLAREELRGIIKGSGYLCGCQSCNFSKVLNAYEFERHAGCKTKHPNNHIYFENGKTIYQIVQELRSTPESLLFDAIQTVFGAPINQKSFRIWKESFQAATRELQRIYGKEELNI